MNPNKPNNTKDEWLAPPWLLEKLGPFDLDPCAPIDRPWPMAEKHYTYLDNGLMMPWEGRVWCNPPYGKHAEHWLAKCANHGNCLALVMARTETKWFHRTIWNEAHAIFFFKGRLYFYHVDGTKAKGNCGAPSCLVAYGRECAKELFYASTEIDGFYIDLINSQ